MTMIYLPGVDNLTLRDIKIAIEELQRVVTMGTMPTPQMQDSSKVTASVADLNRHKAENLNQHSDLQRDINTLMGSVHALEETIESEDVKNVVKMNLDVMMVDIMKEAEKKVDAFIAEIRHQYCLPE
jgi:hypothetical protein